MRKWICLLVMMLAGCGAGATPGPDASSSCTGASDGTACGEGMICARNLCTASTCGDAIHDPRTEECDDGNDVSFDGCEPSLCELTCQRSDECDDFQPCNGEETCEPSTHRCVAAAPLADGTPCGGGGLVCLQGSCTPTRCGDGVVDAAAGEDCEDGNAVDGDGCDSDCTYSCTTDSDCVDDGEPCNGAAVCDTTTNMCGAGAPPAMGSTCVGSGGAEGTCQSMVCIPAGCGNSVVDGGEECDDGNAADGDGCTRMCRFTCSADGDCSDGNACNGLERCSMPGTIGSRCAAPTRVRCDDGNACTTDACNPATGCVATLIDADRDGEAPASLGACGTDCDDTRATVCSGCGEICGDGLDNDCDGTADNGLTTWFADCDGDGYAAAGAVTVMQCSTPAPSATGCGTGAQRWVTRNPATGPDCDDGIAAVHPAATETAGNERDDNCDGRELCYRDSDGDGYRTSGTIESLNTSCRDEGEARAAIPSGDCCDSDDRAHPGATAYYPAPRAGCGGYDYDCNGSAELQLRDAGAYCVRTGTLACSAVGTGWAGTATPPPCGGAAYFISGPASCTPTGTGCAAPVIPQSCR